MRKKTTAEFIQEAIQIHGNKYDYSKVNYTGTHYKVCIICPIHGEFQQYPSDHLHGSGCPYCGNLKKGSTKKDSKETFIKKSQLIHGDKYNYGKVNYINSKTLVEIICSKHGSFQQRPNDHLNGCGCPKCGYESYSNSERDWISKVQKFHNNKYDYSKVQYINYETPVTIICPIHGEFQQSPHNHTRYGCPICNSSKGEKFIVNYLNENKIKFISQYKIQIDSNINSSGIAYIDFYIPEYNLFIEYNGIQHYIPIEYFGGKITLDKQIKRDNYVRNYCKENNINLLEIPYTEENLTLILKNKINEFRNTIS